MLTDRPSTNLIFHNFHTDTVCARAFFFLFFFFFYALLSYMMLRRCIGMYMKTNIIFRNVICVCLLCYVNTLSVFFFCTLFIYLPYLSNNIMLHSRDYIIQQELCNYIFIYIRYIRSSYILLNVIYV